MDEKIKRLLDEVDIDGALVFVDKIPEPSAKVAALVAIAHKIIGRRISPDSFNRELTEQKKSQWLQGICVRLHKLSADEVLKKLLLKLLDYQWAVEMMEPLSRKPTDFEGAAI